jgi:hypothetical protein
MCSMCPKRGMDGIVEEVSELVVITGAFSYTGKYATQLLLNLKWNGILESITAPLLSVPVTTWEVGR